MTEARQTHIVNLTVLHPRKISFDFNPGISLPCVLCHPGKREEFVPKEYSLDQCRSQKFAAEGFRVFCALQLWLLSSRLRVWRGPWGWFNVGF